MIYPDDYIDKIICGDARDILKGIPDNSIDLVFTDPPYPKKYLSCFEILANECPRIMRDKASLVTLLGHYELEQVIKIFDGKLKYRWELNMQQFDGTHPRMLMGIEVMWKPALWYVKGSYPSGRGFLRDGVPVTQSKISHDWEQDIAWSDYYIPRLCPSGIVLDPFCGSGTFLLSAKKFGLHYIGIDISEEYCEIARNRLSLCYNPDKGET